MTQLIPLIPRGILFGDPERTSPRLSPDGRRISWLAPAAGVLNVWIAPIERLDAATPVTRDTGRGIRTYLWAYNSEQILYLQDERGDENWHLHGVDIVSGEERDLTPFAGVCAVIESQSPRFPDELLVALNRRRRQFHDLYQLNTRTGEMSLIQRNPGMFEGGMIAGFVTDEAFSVRFASRVNDDGSASLLAPGGEKGWQEYRRIPMEDTLTTRPLGFDKSDSALYMTDSLGRDTAALVSIDLATGRQTVIAEDAHADAGRILRHPTERTIDAVSFNYQRHRWHIIDPSLEGDFNALGKLQDGELDIVSRSLDDDQWLVAFRNDVSPVAYYHWDRATHQASFLFTDRPALDNHRLAPMRPAMIRSRDGLNLPCYLTVPLDAVPKGSDRPEHPLPVVLLVHGGPWARDLWGFDPLHQLFANRGYAVLSVNYRGSAGFGKSFLNAGNREWGGKMHEDLLDAVTWAVGQRIADPERVAIMGISYGGYATLVGMTMTPEVFACGVEAVGPSNLATLLASIPRYWAPMRRIFKTCVGDHTTREGRAALDRVSPLNYVDNIKKPLLIGQGANDPRVKRAESDRIVRAMQRRNIPVSYLLFPDEGHGFARPENRLAFFAVTDAFLARHLGGRREPLTAADFSRSSMKVPIGAEQLPDLAAALPEP